MPPEQRTYCPYPDCGLMLERPSDPEEYADAPSKCPHCSKTFCISCGMMGWHKVRIGQVGDRVESKLLSQAALAARQCHCFERPMRCDKSNRVAG